MCMTRCTYTSSTNQGDLFGVSSEQRADRPVPKEKQQHRFVFPDRDQIFIGAVTLRDYLTGCGQQGVLKLASALDSMDWTEFESRYTGPGRPPYSPRLMAGLIMYALLKGNDSLRAMETLSRVDLGCMWICAGIQPDHSNIGRFILRHQDEFEGDFFEQVTRLALKITKSGIEDLSGDGTVFQAAASRYRTVKREALDRKLAETKDASNRDPDDPDKTARREKYEAADEALRSREDKRKAKGKPVDNVRVSTTEPDATIQPLKNKSFAPSYKPSVLANKSRVIVGNAVDPSDVSSVISGMLDDAESIGEGEVKRLMLDGNYCNETIINEALSRDFDLLCPVKAETPKDGKKLRKSDFFYNEYRDVYVCPAGKDLTRRNPSKDGSHVQYERSGCAECSLASRCFTPKSRRRIVRRLAIDEAKDALRQVMENPQAKRAYAKRKAMVEPVFSYMRGPMGLQRFRRSGLQKVRLEFSLHASAYNLGRVLAARARRGRRSSLWPLIGQFQYWARRTCFIILASLYRLGSQTRPALSAAN